MVIADEFVTTYSEHYNLPDMCGIVPFYFNIAHRQRQSKEKTYIYVLREGFNIEIEIESYGVFHQNCTGISALTK